MYKLHYAVCFALVIATSCRKNSESVGPERIVIWHTETDDKARKALEQIAEKFEEKNNVQVDIVLNAWGVQAPKILNAINSNALPDIAHVQPFMVKSLVNKDKLSVLDQLIDELKKKHNNFLPAASEIANHDGHAYGIPYAIGITSWSYNIKKCTSGFSAAKSWDQFLSTARANKSKNPDFYITLPGADPFFMEQFYCELLANNAGKMFDDEGKPLFNAKENIETLKFLKALKDGNLLHPNWKSQRYLDQFTQLAKGETSMVLVTYGRASNTITKLAEDSSSANDNTFMWMEQPVGPSNSGGTSIATVDCEPWVIFKKDSQYEKKRIALCYEFLKSFYEASNYLKFTTTTPIHLTPIFANMADDSSYKASIGAWHKWHDQTMTYLNGDKGHSTRPILMPDNSLRGKSWGFLLELQNSRILTDAIIKTLSDDTTPEEIAAEMQTRVETFLDNNGTK